MAKDKMYGFKFFKTVLGSLFRFYYRPTTIGKENIPTDGPILIVGNHVHIMDQCLPIMMTKRPVHYMAKREYFDNKKVAWFFKMSGCIPVDRSIKDDVAKGKALEVLNEGHALGLFPEGTRNGLKEEKMLELYKYCEKEYPEFKDFKEVCGKQKTSQVLYLVELMEDKKIKRNDFSKNFHRSNEYLLELVEKKVIKKKDYENSLLLPFKFGAVSMAKKTNAYLVPFAITGEYKFRSKDLCVRVGKAFKVGDDLEEANDRLRREVIELMKESLKK